LGDLEITENFDKEILYVKRIVNNFLQGFVKVIENLHVNFGIEN